MQNSCSSTDLNSLWPGAQWKVRWCWWNNMHCCLSVILDHWQLTLRQGFNAGVRNASTPSSLLHCPSQKLIVPVWFGWSGNFVKPKGKKAPSGYQSYYQHTILERSLPSSCLGTAFHSAAANPRDPCAPDNYLPTFSLTVMFASFLPQDPFSYYLYFNNSSSLYLMNFILACDFPIRKWESKPQRWGLLIFSWLST